MINRKFYGLLSSCSNVFGISRFCRFAVNSDTNYIRWKNMVVAIGFQPVACFYFFRGLYQIELVFKLLDR